MAAYCLRLAPILAALILSGPAFAQSAGQKIAGSYICTFKSGAVGRGLENAAAQAAARSVGAAVTHVYSTAIRGFAAKMPEQALARIIARNPNIEGCEQDQTVALPAIGIESRGKTSGTAQPSQVTPWGITRVNGGKSGTFKTAWVIDTGIDPKHPDLRVDTGRSRYFAGRSYADENGHGTHVAGTIAAINNTVGVIGVAPGALVVAVRVLDKAGSGSTSGVIAGVDYVAKVAQVGDVANMSLGGGISLALDTAVQNAAAKGIYFAIAAGNSAANAANFSPARAEGVNIFTVSAIDSTDTFASFSNFGNPPIDWAAPGVNVNSTWLSGGYRSISGTSMAAPHVAGLLLLGAGTLAGSDTVKNDRDNNPDQIAVFTTP